MKTKYMSAGWGSTKSDVGAGRCPVWKRVMDVIFILLAFPVVMPLAALIAFLIKCSSSGAVLFRQERMGYMGRRFICLKFRSMREHADANVHKDHISWLMDSGEPMVKLDERNDPRLYPLGSFLRLTGLDELPQLINIVRGEMSLVGPRPCLPYEFEKYVPWQKRRCGGLPGLTGLWQVEGKNRTSFEEMLRLDLHYLDSSTPWLDLKIILKTIPALIAQCRESRRNQNDRRTNKALQTKETPWEKQSVSE